MDEVMDMGYERGCKANCFSSSTSVMDLFVCFGGGAAHEIYDAKSIKFNVKLHSFHSQGLCLLYRTSWSCIDLKPS